MQAIPEAQLLRLEDTREKVNVALEALIQREIDKGSGEVAKLSGEILLSGGKRLRPLLGIFCYEASGGEDIDEIMDLAIAFELIHTATLIHDDINDAAKLRRGIMTLHERIGQPKAIIAGDWLFVQGYGLSGRYTKECIDLIREACANIAVSEFKQLDHVLDLSTSPEDYLQIVRGKTAGPFSAVCESAAIIAGATPEQSKALGRFGMELGIAFQLMDDLLDLRGDERMGKLRGKDIIEGKMTLPLIHALTLLHGKRRQRLSEILNNFSDNLWDELMTLLDTSDSIHYSECLMHTHLERAIQELDSLPDTNSKRLLLNIVEKMQSREN